MILTLKFRLRDKHAKELRRQARAVNFVWNYCNEVQQKAVRAGRPWFTAHQLQKLTAGSSKDLGLHSETIAAVCEHYAISRRTHKRPWLRFRGRKSLGWVPFKVRTVGFNGETFKFLGAQYGAMHLDRIRSGDAIRGGSFNCDTRGRWYFNAPIDIPESAFHKEGGAAVGIDLGLKDLAVLSTDETVSAPQHYRRAQERLGKAQRANKTRLAKTISAKIANARRDHLHKVSASIASRHALIFVGDVSSSKLTQTKMAKSVLDAGWSTLRMQLSYKAIRHGGRMIEVDESHSSQTCSACGSMPEGRPKGIAGLGIREWTCSDCGSVHDRDVNAARNILARGMASLAEEAAKAAAHPRGGE